MKRAGDGAEPRTRAPVELGPGERGAVEAAAAVRRGAGLFALADRGLVEVAGEDRVRWLDGMLTNDLKRLAAGTPRSGCRALALTRKGGIVADLRVWVHPEVLWLETDAAAIPALLEHLRGLVVADDVRLAALGPAVALLALEGPGAESALTRAAAGGACPAPDAVAPIEIAGASAAISAHGASGERAFRIAVAREAAGAVAEALAEAGRPLGLVAGSAEVFEILRIEAGTPRFGAEVGPDVLPAEAGLETAISFDKGCYIGQEIVARIESRGRVRRRLAGLRLLDGPAPEPGTPIAAGGIPLGAITSGCVSPARGSCGMGFVRLPWDAPGTGLDVGGRPARTAALPLVRAGGGGGGA